MDAISPVSLSYNPLFCGTQEECIYECIMLASSQHSHSELEVINECHVLGTYE